MARIFMRLLLWFPTRMRIWTGWIKRAAVVLRWMIRAPFRRLKRPNMTSANTMRSTSDSAPTIINTFLETFDYSGKRIILFATSGGSSIDRAVKDLQKQYPGLHICGGKLLNGKVTGNILWINWNTCRWRCFLP